MSEMSTSTSYSILYQSCITINDSLNTTLDQCVMCCFIHIFLHYLVVQDENDYPDQNPTYPSSSNLSSIYPSSTYPENFFHIMDRE